MEKVSIVINKKQFITLLKLIYCGEWVINAHKTSSDKVSKETEDLEQQIFALASHFNLSHWVEYDEPEKRYFPTADMEEEFHDYIDQYNKRDHF